MPKVNPGESRKDYVNRCVPILVKEGKKQDQAVAVCNSMYRQSVNKKESSFSQVRGIETKEIDGVMVKSGYLATTHLDNGWWKDDNTYVRDKISSDTLFAWRDSINSGNPLSNKMSIQHDIEPKAAGVIKPNARVDRFDDGHYGLWIDTSVDDTSEDYSVIKRRFDTGFYDAMSVEYDTGLLTHGKYYDGAAVEIDMGDYVQRTILPNTHIKGGAYVDRPMNPYAVIVKSLSNIIVEVKGDNMTEQKTVENQGQDILDNTEKKQNDKPEGENKMKQQYDDPAKQEIKQDKEYQEFLEFKKIKAREQEEKRYSEMKSSIIGELDKKFDSLKEQVEKKRMLNPNENVETKEYKEYKQIFEPKNEISVSEQFQRAGRYAESKSLIFPGGWKKSATMAEGREFKHFRTNGTRLEYKALGITTNQNTDTDYLLSAAELSDVFDPVIYNALNQETVTWNLLRKEDYSSKGNNQVQFTLKTLANATAGFYAGDSVSTGNVTRQKYMTKFKKAQVGVQISGDMIAAARGGPIGDVFAREVQDSTEDLLAVINAALFAEVGLETAAAVIGFEYVSDSAGNTTLYNVTRSAANKLAPDTATDTYINGSSATITLDNLRLAIEKAVIDGAPRDQLVFITHPTQVRLYKGILQDLQRLVPTSSRVGFEGMPELDGIPIFEDKDCTSDNWHLIPMDSTFVGMWVPPTLEMLGKDSDAEKGFIKTYFAVVYRRPRSVIMIYDNATS